ncbi:MAG TPA: CehA/McbA family metallohydrolase [Caldilineaceae bacterium]|nr:CehA/McbA family metallohydrolase [Caldilineaceae bacterium]
MSDAMNRFALSLTAVANPAPGWYEGDFHCHTHHSDGALTAPDLLALARSEGLDFFAITDHNTLDAYPHFGSLDGVCVIPGLEVTFDRGHYNVFGLIQDGDWLAPVAQGPTQLEWAKSGLDPNELLAASAAQGLLNSINHPLLAPWAWLFGDTDLAHLHCLEIWNDPSWPDNRVANPQALELWTRWLNAGYRITAIGGSDFHRPVNKPAAKPGPVKPPDRLGLPRTVVYAEELSGAAILAGLRRRQVYVSMGAHVRFQARAGGQVYPIGADLGAQAGPVELEGQVAPVGRSGVARLLQDGVIVAETLLRGDPVTLRHTAELSPETHTWFRLDVLDGNGLILAVTNPIFAGPARPPASRRYGDFVDVTAGKQPALR